MKIEKEVNIPRSGIDPSITSGAEKEKTDMVKHMNEHWIDIWSDFSNLNTSGLGKKPGFLFV